MSISKMVAAAAAIDKAGTGYDQHQRWTFYDRKAKKIIPGKEGDCSSVCGAIAALGGYPVNLDDPFYTGNFREKMVKAGFTAIRFTGLSQLRAGDFVVGPGHVEFVPRPGRMFSASIDERGKISGGKAGDQAGREVLERPAYLRAKGWDWILRPPADPKPAPAPKPTVSLPKAVKAAKTEPPAKGRPMSAKADTKRIGQALVAEGLLAKGYPDGHWGQAQRDAYAAWQRKLGYKGKDADGIPGGISLKKLGAKHGFAVKD